MKRLLATLMAMAASCGAYAAGYTWTGAGTPNEDGSLNWSDSANWNATAPAYPGLTANGAASAGDTATFPADTTAKVRLDVSTKITSVTAKAAGIDLTFDSPDGNALTLSGSLVLGDGSSTGNSGSVVTLDGVKIITSNVMNLQSGASLVLKNAAELKVTNLNAYSANYEEGLIDLSGRSVLTVSQLDIGGGAKIVIDDSTVTCSGHCYFNDVGQGGGRFVFKGAHPLLQVKGSNFRSGNNAAYTLGADFDFLVPAGGYAEPPVQYLHASSKFLNGASNCKTLTRINLLSESPAIVAGDPLDVTLVTTVAGVLTTAASLNGGQNAGSITIGYNDAATAIVGHISSSARTLDIESVNAFASGANLANVHREDLTEGDQIILQAEPVVTKRGTATPTGIRVFDVDPATLARTEVAGSPFSGTSITYTHGSGRRAIVWQWSWQGEGDIFVSPSVGSDTNGGTSWNDAFATVEKAFETLADGDVVVLDAGEHPIADTLTLAVGATVKGFGMFETEIVPAAPATCNTRGMMLNHASTLIEDLAITGFFHRNGYNYYGVGLYINTAGGTARNCRFYNNTGTTLRTHGQGVYMVAGSIYNCLIDHNVTTSDCGGAGLKMEGKTTYAENCLICDNVAGDGNYQGGGVWLQSGTMVNCTIANNTIRNGSGGGVWVGTDKNNPAKMYNCIVWGNTAANDASAYAPDVKINGDADPASYIFTSLYGNATATGCVALDPEFADAANGDYSLRLNSPAIDAGSDEAQTSVGTVDLAGNPRRVGTIDMGCYEADTSVFACGFAASKTEAFIDETVTLTATVRGAQGGLSYAWTALEGSGVSLVADGAEATVTFTQTGWYGFRLTVTDSAAQEPVSATREAYVHVAPRSVTLAVGDDLQAAVDAAIDGQELVLADGVHAVPTQVTIDKGVRIVGAGYDICSIANQSTTSRVLYINHPEAVVSGVTITGGSQGVPRYSYGMGVWIGANGGTVTNCCITGNVAKEYYQIGGGVGMTGDKALLTHCIVYGNTVIHANSNSSGGGIGISAGTVDTCLVYDNESAGVGGGLATVASGRPYGTIVVRNSTFTRNNARTYGGGVWIKSDTKNTRIENCVFAGNTAPNDTLLGAPEWSPEYNANAKNLANNYNTATNAVFSCAFYAANPLGAGSLAIDQPFLDPGSDDFHLKPGNGAVDAGVWYEGIAADLDGKPRDATPDMGCYELDKSQFTCSFAIMPEVAFNDQLVSFTPAVQNPPENVAYTWTLTDRFGAETVFADVAPTQAIAKCGWYSVKLKVADVDNPLNTAEFEVAEALHVAPHELYAVGGGENASIAYPFDSWETAHTNLLELSEEMIDGTHVFLGEGEFIVTNEFLVAVGATVTGMGMDRSVVRYRQPSGATGRRVIRINHPSAVVERLTVTGGSLQGDYNQYGSGVYIDTRGGTLQDCHVTGNSSATYHTLGALGIRSAFGYAHRCVIDNNRAATGSSYGGGLSLTDGYADNCLIVSNAANFGGGVFLNGSQHAEVRNCTVADNFSLDSKSVAPGGLYLNNCGSDVRVVNCVFSGNQPGAAATAANCRGYPEFDMYYNSTHQTLDSSLVSNILVNCLLDIDLAAVGASSVGRNGLAAVPQFRDAAASDYRLRPGSPAIDAGDNLDYTADSIDLLGAPRIRGFGSRAAKADLGCYESLHMPGRLIFIIH